MDCSTNQHATARLLLAASSAVDVNASSAVGPHIPANIGAQQTELETSAATMVSFCVPPPHAGAVARPPPNFRVSVVAMTGAAIAIEDASATDSIRSVKERVFALNRKLPVRRQRLMYRPGPRGIEPLADDETLGGAGVAQDGSAELDILLADLTADQIHYQDRDFLNAARNGSIANVLELINAGANIEYHDKHGWTALRSASREGHVDCVRLLVESGANIDANSDAVWSPLNLAAAHGHTACLQVLLEAGADARAGESAGRATALIFAAQHGKSDCVRALLKRGVDTEARCEDGDTALMWAAY